ncbi:glycoside hydrolase domain-containing protein [Alicyclobacillus sp. ALC3]|uniref:glycoside hydrolase domain-containing protein n=1 Tax=Alicyclobacillus sp. ALC3 TaxID=2796143 RepID=UPI00237912EE|nr:glycoside hydrolase domain-containing protein [Alicyclobacillus sp. ALC3]WDL96962.1 DUF1906 domain-containing protein [Alicyclobacillus sp. ALC3]
MKPITIAVDRYTPFSVSELQKLKQVRVRGLPVGAIVAYIGRHTRGLMNGITPQDLKNYVDHGFKVIFNFEGMSNSRAYFTAAEGYNDGHDIVLELKWLGVAPDPGIIAYDSVDYDAYTQADFAAVDAYQTALMAELSGQFSDGEYGGIAVLKHSDGTKHAPSGEWQTVAWSNNQVLPGIKMYQVQVNAWVAGMLVDINEVYEDPGWYPRTGGEDVQTTKVKVNGAEFPAVVYDGSTYILWTEDRQIPGFQMKNVNGEWNFSFDKTASTPSSAITSADIHLADGSTTTLKP